MHVSPHFNRHMIWLMLLTAAVAAGCAGAPPTKPADGERICITASEALAARIGETQDPSAVLYTAADGTHTLCFNLSDANRITLDLGSGIAAAPTQPGVPPPPAAQGGKGGGWIWDTPPAVPPPPSSPTSAAAVPDTAPVKPMPGVTLPTSFADSEMLPILGSPIRGGAQAPVTLVVFEDMQCQFCARALNTEEQIFTTFGDQVRVVSKHYPLPFHKQARSAAQAAIAAGNQGKFWEYRHLLMHNQKALHDEALVAYAQRLGLDVARFNADRQSKATDTIIDRDMALARKVSVKGTPHFFINGRRLSGAQPFDVFRKAIQDELDTGGGESYAQRVKGNYAPPKPKPAALPDDTVFRVPVEKGDAILGKTPKAVVTIVEFSEFQCPFCGRVQDALRKVRETYGDQVRIVFKHNPLPFHKQAEPAARAAIAAGNQGKFWEYHDLLFDNRQALSTDDLEGYAQQLKLNMNRFRRDMQAARTAKLRPLIKKVGVPRAPSF
ncbi:MAG: thioredoxin domain-containing protein [Myxococcota bacterium]